MYSAGHGKYTVNKRVDKNGARVEIKDSRPRPWIIGEVWQKWEVDALEKAKCMVEEIMAELDERGTNVGKANGPTGARRITPIDPSDGQREWVGVNGRIARLTANRTPQEIAERYNEITESLKWNEDTVLLVEFGDMDMWSKRAWWLAAYAEALEVGVDKLLGTPRLQSILPPQQHSISITRTQRDTDFDEEIEALRQRIHMAVSKEIAEYRWKVVDIRSRQ